GAYEAHAGQQRIVLAGLPGRLAGVGERPVEVVQDRQQLLGERGHAALASGRRLARHALSVVLEVSLGALGEREVLVALGGRLDELGEVALDLGRVLVAALGECPCTGAGRWSEPVSGDGRAASPDAWASGEPG